MRSMVTVSKSEREPGYRANASGKFGDGYLYGHAGMSIEDAAAFAAREAIRYCTDEGCDLFISAEIEKLLPDFGGRDIEIFLL